MLKGWIVGAFIAAAATPAIGQSWRVESDRDAFTDQRRVRAVYQTRQISAAVRCHDGALDALFLVSYIGESDATVRYRIDRGDVMSNVWSAGTSRDTLFAWDPGEVGRRMANGSTMVFEHDDFAGTPHRYTISLGGSGAAIRQVFAACDVPMIDPKSQDDEIWTRVVDELDKMPKGDLKDLQIILALLGNDIAEDGRRSLATYQGLSKFYSTYWRGCEAGIDTGPSCRSWRSGRSRDPDFDYPTEAVELLAEFLKEPPKVGDDATSVSNESTGSPRPAVITNPTWNLRPAGDFPERAQSRGIESGTAQLECTVNANGSVSGCSIISETPSGAGFGQAALAGARRAQLTPRSVDSVSAGGKVRFTTRFDQASLIAGFAVSSTNVQPLA